MTDAETVRLVRNILEDWEYDRATPAQAFDRLYRLFHPAPRAEIRRYPEATVLVVDGYEIASDGTGGTAFRRKLHEIADLINQASSPTMRSTGG